MPERIYNEVIVPFLSVVTNPTQRDDLDKLGNPADRGEVANGGTRKTHMARQQINCTVFGFL